MKQKIVIITSKYLHPFVEKAFEDFKEDCTVTIADYTNFDHITDIYRKYEKTADGFIFGSPVHYAAASGSITSFLDRVFYSGGKHLQFKPASVIASARRAGTTATLDQLTKYLTISNMPVVSSQYWNMVHGNTPEEVVKDLEGMQTMRVLGRNMAWLLKCIDLGKKNNINRPDLEDRETTNFIR